MLYYTVLEGKTISYYHVHKAVRHSIRKTVGKKEINLMESLQFFHDNGGVKYEKDYFRSLEAYTMLSTIAADHDLNTKVLNKLYV